MPILQSLDGPWTFAPAEAGTQRAPSKGWLPAKVPGNVHLDLMAAGRLEDPLTQDHEAAALWVEQKDWWYKRRFTPQGGLQGPGRAGRGPASKGPEGLGTEDQGAGAGKRVFLVAEGLDTWCTLWLNGKLLGRTENMFVEHSFDVGALLKPGLNELLLRFESPMAALKRLEQKHGFRAAVGEEKRVHGRKVASSFGWDWGLRLPTSGVFKSLRLEAREDLRVADAWVRTLKADPKEAFGELWVEVASDRAGTFPFSARLGAWEHRGPRRLKKGLNRFKLDWKVDRPGLWWPRGWGEAVLQTVEVSVAGGEAFSFEAGLRTVALDRTQDKAGEAFGFRVNGCAVYAKGANWIPADSLLGRLAAERVERLVGLAAHANYTLLRVWGGGMYESEAFYRACDRLGILVWQDFPFACGEAPEHPDFLAQVQDEARKALRRLRRHPSLALLCGNNENHLARRDGWFKGRAGEAWGFPIYHRVLPAVCASEAPDIPYWPGSPFGGADPNSEALGDRHNWQVWAQFKDPEEYRLDRGRFLSEFGMAALPNTAALALALGGEERWPQSRDLELHDKVENGGGVARIAYYICRSLPLAAGLDDFRYLSQVMQSRALRTGIEHWRRLKPHNQGALVWQHNDSWPVLSWSLLDSLDTPKLAYYGVREAFDDVLLSGFESGVRAPKTGEVHLPPQGLCEVWLSADGPAGIGGRLRVERWNCLQREAVLLDRPLSLRANQSRRVWSATRKECGISDPREQYLAAFFENDLGVRRRCLLFFERPVRMNLRPQAIRLSLSTHPQARGGARDVLLRSKSLALACEVQAPVAGSFSDQGFDLLPGEARRIAFAPGKPRPSKQPGITPSAWAVKTLNALLPGARRP